MENLEYPNIKRELVSVIIPLYNHESYIKECLDSVLQQEQCIIELLLLDDGSTDRGFEVARKWSEQHWGKLARVNFDRQMNAGISQTFDRLIRRSTGRYIVLLASDDEKIKQRAIDQIVKYTGNDIQKIEARVEGNIQLNWGNDLGLPNENDWQKKM